MSSISLSIGPTNKEGVIHILFDWQKPSLLSNNVNNCLFQLVNPVAATWPQTEAGGKWHVQPSSRRSVWNTGRGTTEVLRYCDTFLDPSQKSDARRWKGGS